MKPSKYQFIFLIALAVIIAFGCSADHAAYDAASDLYTPLSVQVTPSPLPQYSPCTLRIGDYVEFGQYNSIPIVWVVIQDSSAPGARKGDIVVGDPLLFSDSILCKKAFDATKVSYITDDGNTIPYISDAFGSNNWKTSTLRAWLNSSSKAGEVAWLKEYPPAEEYVTENAYAEEKGFLADGNFTIYERALIKPISHKSLLYFGSDNAEGGSEWYDYSTNRVNGILCNYDTAFYMMVTDRVFLLDPKQLDGFMHLFGNTDQVNADYWICAPDTYIYMDSSSSNVLYVGELQRVFYKHANDGSIGVRPAMILDRNQIHAFGGSGTADNPYILTDAS